MFGKKQVSYKIKEHVLHNQQDYMTLSAFWHLEGKNEQNKAFLCNTIIYKFLTSTSTQY